MRQRVHAPSDLRSVASGRRLRVGGRLRRQPRSDWQLADAIDSIPVEGIDGHDDGSLVVVDGVWRDGMLEVERVVDQHTIAASGSLRESNRLLDRGVGRALIERARALRAVRSWFDDQGFLEVDTAQRVPSPGLDLHLDAFRTEDAFLITSPEYQMKRLLVGGLPRIYQMVHCFRAGERGDSHNSEFLMLEWYRAFAGIEDVIADTEQIIARVAETLANEQAVVREGRRIDLRSPFEQITVLDAFSRYCGLDADTTLRLAEFDEETYFRRLVEDVEPALAAMRRGVVLRDFPAVHASLARRRADDPRLCERFEVYVAGVELCNGFGELTDVREQRERFERDRADRVAAGKPDYPIDNRFVRALEEGMPPSGGNALGLDRLIALCLGAKRIADVMAFPDEWL